VSYIKQVVDRMYPPENRVVAGVAFARTFQQSIKSAIVVALGGVGVSIAVLQSLDVQMLLLALGALLINAAGAAIAAWDDVARNGMSESYLFALEEQAYGKYGIRREDQK
jgi:hypothetical protein